MRQTAKSSCVLGVDKQPWQVQGGFKPKHEEWKQAARPQLLAVEDPQEAGRDIGSGSFNIKAVRLLSALEAPGLHKAAVEILLT